MQTQRQVWKPFRQYNVVNIVVSLYLVVFAVCALYYTGVVSRANVKGVYAKTFTPCSKNDYVHVVVEGDTLAHIATYYGLREQAVAAYDHFADPVTLYIGQRICIQGTLSSSHIFYGNLLALRAPARVTTQMRLVKPVEHPAHRYNKPVRPVARASSANSVRPSVSAGGYAALRIPLVVLPGFVNVFAYGQCTWWAAQRYFQLHDVAVPWRINADAGQWITRAYDNGWRVSRKPVIGSILVLQGGVQGAGAVGHVGIVEKVLNNGMAIASSMNWGSQRNSVTFTIFRPGLGVAFVER